MTEFHFTKNPFFSDELLDACDKDLTEWEEKIRADERMKVLNETRMFVDKHSVEIGKREGIREFAEILKSKPYFDEVHNMESIPISFIDEVLAEYEKEQE